MWWGEGELISLLFTSCTAVVRHRTFLSTSNYRILPPSIGWNTINLGYIGSLKSGNLIFINWKFDMWWNSTVRQKNVRYMRNLIYPLYPEVYRTWIVRHRCVNVTYVVIDSTDQWAGAILPLKIFSLNRTYWDEFNFSIFSHWNDSKQSSSESDNSINTTVFYRMMRVDSQRHWESSPSRWLWMLMISKESALNCSVSRTSLNVWWLQ